jgi:hypothetical protein
MSKSKKGGQGLTDLLTIAGLLSLSQLTTTKKEGKKKKSSTKKSSTKKVVKRKSPTKKVVKRKSPTKKVVKRKSPTKKVVKRKSPTKKVVRRKKGGMMTTLAPQGASASLSALALAALSRSDMRKPIKKLSKKKSPKKRKGGNCGSCSSTQKGGGSDWMVVNNARGPANYPDNGWMNGKTQFSSFSATGEYIPNSTLAKGTHMKY